MGLSFRPVDSTFYDLFAESAQHLVVGAALLAEMLSDGNDRDDVAKRMREAEHAADETTHEIVRRVNSTFVTPIDREDIYGLATQVDDIVDYAEEAADFLGLYKIEAPMAQAQALTKVLGSPVLMSSEFNNMCPRPLRSLGNHRLRGVKRAVEVFTLP